MLGTKLGIKVCGAGISPKFSELQCKLSGAIFPEVEDLGYI